MGRFEWHELLHVMGASDHGGSFHARDTRNETSHEEIYLDYMQTLS
jgi:hypothetical protein